MQFLQVAGEPLSVGATVLGHIGQLPVTNTMVMSFFNFVVFIILCILAQRFTVANPGKFQIAVEMFFGIVKGFIEQIVGNSKTAWRILPMIVTLVFFILVSNLIMTILPILAGFTFNGLPMFRSHTNDFNTTVALAVGMIFMVQAYSVGKNNIVGHILRYIPIHTVIKEFRKGFRTGLISLISLFTGVLDIVSEFARIVSLSLRLFGNMFAGELLTGVLMTMFAIFLPLPIMMLSTLSGVIQSIVFGSLVSSYLGGVLNEE